MSSARLSIFVLAVLSLPVSAFAVIKTPYPLKEVNRAFGEIFEAEVSSVDTKTGKVELSWRKDLKGKTAFAKIVLGRPKTATDLPKLIERFFIIIGNKLQYLLKIFRTSPGIDC